MKETIDTIIKWHTETFPDATFSGQIEKFSEEEEEFREARALDNRKESYELAIKELADMFIVCCDIARFDSVESMDYFNEVREGFYKMFNEYIGVNTFVDFQEALNNKMEKNRKRIWNKTADGQYHHENGIED